MLIPDDKVHLIRQLLNDEIKVTIEDQDDLMTNPWKGLLGGGTMNTVAVLKLTLASRSLDGTGFQSGKNILVSQILSLWISNVRP